MAELVAWLEDLDEWCFRLEAGEALPRGGDELVELLRGSIRLGLSPLPTLAALRRELGCARDFTRQCRRLEQVAAFRLILAVCFGLAGRAWLTGGDVLPASLADVLALGGALTVGGAFQWLARRHLPRAWVWRDGLSADGWLWLRALLGERVGPPALVARLESLRADELRRGVCRQAARWALLGEFAALRRDADVQTLARIESVWPLAELIGIGLPVVLILLVPARSLASG